MPEEIRLSIRNIVLTALHWPAKSNCRILALHGWLDNAQSFAPLAEQLPEYDFIALDFPGHGHSDHRPAGEVLHYIDYIADVYAVLKALEWDNCVLVGHSMGAGVASLFASAFNEKLAGLICFDGLGPLTSNVDELVARLNKSVRLNTKSTAGSKTVYADVQQAVEARYKAGDLSRNSVKRLVERGLQRVDDGFVWRSDARLRLPSLYYFSEPQAQAYLRQIQVPTLMVRPRDSAYRADKLLKTRADLIEDLTWVDVPGHHHAHMDQVESIVAPFNTFVNKVMTGADTA